MPRGMNRAPVYDMSLGTVHVYSAKGNVPKAVAELIDDRVCRVGHAHTGQASGPLLNEDGGDVLQAMRPTVAAVFYATTGRDSSRVQRNARRVGAQMVAGLPEAGQWLRSQIDGLVRQHNDVAIVVSGGAW